MLPQPCEQLKFVIYALVQLNSPNVSYVAIVFVYKCVMCPLIMFENFL